MKNKIRLRPTPDYDSPAGYLIVHSYMIRGTTEETFGEIPEEVFNSL
ncbi:MAG: hypothetical protein ACOCRO_03235 [Halanaerobiales bacterium]